MLSRELNGLVTERVNRSFGHVTSLSVYLDQFPLDEPSPYLIYRKKILSVSDNIGKVDAVRVFLQ